jgi:hypothetical protein
LKKNVYDELNTGVLKDMLHPKRKLIKPNCDLDKAQLKLHKFYFLKSNNKPVKSLFLYDSIDWFPSAVSELFWMFFFQYTKYTEIANNYINSNYKVYFFRKNNFFYFLKKIKRKSKFHYRAIYLLRLISLHLISTIIMARNYLFFRDCKNKILFLRWSPNDFRTKDILSDLSGHFNIIQLLNVPPSQLPKFFLNNNIMIMPYEFLYPKLVDIDPNFVDPLNLAALDMTNRLIRKHRSIYYKFNNFFKHSSFKALIGLDDCNYPYPYIYAAKANNIITIGIQHGLYAKRHEAYVMKHLKQHLWFDNLIVWGQFWKNHFLKFNKFFNKKNIFIASNKHSYDYFCGKKNIKAKTILIPYEFLCDSIQVGIFINFFLKNGFIVYFKPRVDEPISDQIECYSVKKHRNFRILPMLSASDMADIDIIAGTQTTYLFDLLPFNKPIWILETDFKLLYDMIDLKLARLVKLSEVSDAVRLNKIYRKDMRAHINIKRPYYFGDKSISSVILNIIEKN